MGKIEKISADDFMDMFAAISYLQEQRIFNADNLKNYIKTFYVVDDDVIKQIDEKIARMVESKMISKVDNHEGLYRIGERIPFQEIIANNYGSADGMVDFFFDFVSFPIPNVQLITDQDKKYIKQKD